MKNTSTTLKTLVILLGLNFAFIAPAKAVDEFTQAKTLYENQNFLEAYQAFAELIQQNYNDLNINLVFALTATKLDKTNEAIAAFERVLMINPQHSQAKIELAKLYFKNGDNRLAETYLRAAFHPQLPPKQIAEIRFYLSKINRPSWTGSVMFGLAQDSNVNHASAAESWYIPLFNSNLDNSSTAEIDNYHHEMVTLNHFYDASFTHGLVVNNQWQLYSRSHVQQDDYNLLFLRYNPTIIIPFEGYQFATGLHFDHLDYGGKSYLQTYGINPKLFWKLPSKRTISSQLKLTKTNYQADKDKDRNALFAEVSGQYTQVFADKLTWLVNLALQGERKDQGSRFDVDYHSVNLLTKLSYKLPDEWQIGASMSLKQKRYQDASPAFKTARQDNQRTFAVNVSKSLSKRFLVQAQLENTLNQSNHSPFEFDKNVFLINFISKF